MPFSKQKAKRNTLNLRINTKLRGLIEQAAELYGKNRTDFVLDAARDAAENTLLDRPVFMADPRTYAAFVALLDAPPCPNDRLRRWLQTPAPWEK